MCESDLNAAIMLKPYRNLDGLASFLLQESAENSMDTATQNQSFAEATELALTQGLLTGARWRFK